MVKDFLTELVTEVCLGLGYPYPDGVIITPPPAHMEGDFSVNIALLLTKVAGKSSRDLAQEFTDYMVQHEAIESIYIAGPGFLNIVVTSDFLTLNFAAMQRDPRQGVGTLSKGKVVVDYGGPNVAKPLHVGHLRSSVIGEAIKRIARFAGDEVYGDIHLGDWGTPMGMLLAQLESDHPEWPYFNTSVTEFPEESPVSMDDLQVLYPKAATRFKSDPEFMRLSQQATGQLQQGRIGYRALWHHFVSVSVAAIKENMDRLDVSFELWNGESNVHDLIQPMLDSFQENHQSEMSDGAMVIPLPEAPSLPPLMLIKSDGAFLYSTTDMATLIDRVSHAYTKSWYVVDQRQKLHFQQVFLAAKKTGIVPESMELKHFGFGTVNGPDGRPFKTRSGNAMQLKDLLDLAYNKATEKIQESGLGKAYPVEEQQNIVRCVAIAALKFTDLINHRESDYSFDSDRFMNFEGKTGPYLLYTAARISSILRKYTGDLSLAKLTQVTALERPLLLTLTEFDERITQCYQNGQPQILCEHLYDVATAYNRFYHSCNILQETNLETQSGWLALSESTKIQLQLGLSLLGMNIPERM